MLKHWYRSTEGFSGPSRLGRFSRRWSSPGRRPRGCDRDCQRTRRRGAQEKPVRHLRSARVIRCRRELGGEACASARHRNHLGRYLGRVRARRTRRQVAATWTCTTWGVTMMGAEGATIGLRVSVNLTARSRRQPAPSHRLLRGRLARPHRAGPPGGLGHHAEQPGQRMVGPADGRPSRPASGHRLLRGRPAPGWKAGFVAVFIVALRACSPLVIRG
jgi:hypothetical protein